MNNRVSEKKSLILFIGIIFFSFLLISCSRELSECEGPKLDTEKILGLRKNLFSSSAQAYLVVPNPIEATRQVSIQATDSILKNVGEGFFLSGLMNPSRLENSFLKIRIHDVDDAISTLAAPNASGDFNYPVSDIHYSEAMAYYSVTSMMNYVEALGFSVVKNRPLYVMVRAKSDSNDPGAVNALYTHNYLDPSQPRFMRLFGDTAFSPGQDRDMYWHEFGHLFNESVSHESGIDYAADTGAVFTESSALHECLADYLAESVGNKGDIGKWIARNFKTIPIGQALRSAEAKNDDFNDFKNVSINDGTGANPERYRMAEWCTRVLWDLRSQFVKEDEVTGSLFSDRLIYSAVSLLGKDTSVSQFRDALETADNQLHCGLHNRSIKNAFESRGFQKQVETIVQPLTLQAVPVGISYLNNESVIGSVKAGGDVAFSIQITNPNAAVARNVRIYLDSLDSKLVPFTYMQGYGDLSSKQTLVIGSGKNLSIDSSVYGTIDKNARPGTRIRYRLRVVVENGPEGILEGTLTL